MCLTAKGIDLLFELASSRQNNSGRSLHNSRPNPEPNFINGSMLWEPFSVPGSSELCESLWTSGWLPVYMRGSGKSPWLPAMKATRPLTIKDMGQTWFHGPQPIHIRFMHPEYIPQLLHLPMMCPSAYLAIGKEWIEPDALQLGGFPYQVVPGYCILESNVSYVCFVY